MTYGGYTILCDCGSSSIWNPGEVAVNYLAGFGCDRLDAVILTHYHEDHTSGIYEVLYRMDVSVLFMPEPLPSDYDDYERIKGYADEFGVKTVTVGAPVTCNIGGSSLTIIEPVGRGTE